MTKRGGHAERYKQLLQKIPASALPPARRGGGGGPRVSTPTDRYESHRPVEHIPALNDAERLKAQEARRALNRERKAKKG
jgi:hypothetical protein